MATKRIGTSQKLGHPSLGLGGGLLIPSKEMMNLFAKTNARQGSPNLRKILIIHGSFHTSHSHNPYGKTVHCSYQKPKTPSQNPLSPLIGEGLSSGPKRPPLLNTPNYLWVVHYLIDHKQTRARVWV